MRNVFRWYLRKFPLRDGKALLYEKLHSRLLPEERLVTARMDHGFQMKLDLLDLEQRKVYFFGHYHERYEAKLIARVLEEKDSFWDIGANVGYFSLLAATVLSPDGSIISFEPGTNAYERLQENISLNPFSHIRAFNLAAAEAPGEAILYLSEEIADSSANLVQPKEGQVRQERIKTISLDEFLRETGGPPPDLIKMDVEGAELAVLRGAEDLLRTAQPLLLIEMEGKNFREDNTVSNIRDLLEEYGYGAAYLFKGKWYVQRQGEPLRGRNIFWFKPAAPEHQRKVTRIPLY